MPNSGATVETHQQPEDPDQEGSSGRQGQGLLPLGTFPLPPPPPLQQQQQQQPPQQQHVQQQQQPQLDGFSRHHVLPSFHCPITREPMQDPVIALDGHSYECSAIHQWFQTHQTSPVTNERLQSTLLLRNFALRNAMGEWQELVVRGTELPPWAGSTGDMESSQSGVAIVDSQQADVPTGLARGSHSHETDARCLRSPSLLAALSVLVLLATLVVVFAADGLVGLPRWLRPMAAPSKVSWDCHGGMEADIRPLGFEDDDIKKGIHTLTECKSVCLAVKHCEALNWHASDTHCLIYFGGTKLTKAAFVKSLSPSSSYTGCMLT